MLVHLSTVRRAAVKAAACAMVAFLLASVFAIAIVVIPHATRANHSQCSDGIDNDNDNIIDYPQDDSCDTLDDDYEGTSTSGVFVSITDDKDTVSAGGNMVYLITLNQQRDEQRTVNVTLHLPTQANLVSGSDGGTPIGKTSIRWTNLTIYKNAPRRLTVNANVSPEAVQGQYLVARVVVDGAGAEATDTTLIQNTVPNALDPSLFTVAITDRMTTMLPGETSHYVVTVHNRSKNVIRTDVRVVMPEQAEYLDSSPGSTHDMHNVVWRNVSFAHGEKLEFTFTTRLEDRVPDRTLLRARVTVGGATALDQTSVRFGLPDNALSVSLNDGQQSARVGDVITYVIRVKNSSPVVGSNLSVDAALPLYGEFVSATEGGRWDGANVRWLNLPIGANSTRELSFSVRVRGDAPLGATLVGSVAVDGKTARDTTLVSHNSRRSNNRLANGPVTMEPDYGPVVYPTIAPENPAYVDFPDTGADMGSLAGLFVAAIGTASAFGQRKWLKM